MTWFCCDTGYALIDVWTLVHTAFWLFVGSCLWGLKANRWWALLGCFLVSLAWEAFEEFVAFPRWPDKWLDPESWWNSWISDPLTCLVGVLAIYLILENRPRRTR
jgi:hypothetical protein